MRYTDGTFAYFAIKKDFFFKYVQKGARFSTYNDSVPAL